MAALLAAAVVARPAQLIALSVSMALAFGILEFSVRRMPKASTTAGHYRPLELMSRFTGSDPTTDPPMPRFQPNGEIRMMMPHGDLLAIDPNAPGTIAEPRSVYFKADSHGFRNDADYAGEKWLLLGDSFVACTGSDQSACLGNVLRRNHQIDTYALALPAEPDFYMARLAWALNRLPVPHDVRGLVFEGNDFRSDDQLPVRQPRPPSWYDQRKLETMELVRNRLTATEYLFRASRRFERMVFPPPEQLVEVHRVGERHVGFWGYQVDYARCTRLSLNIAPSHPSELLRKIGAAFFIPTSYRTYAPHLKDGRPPLPEPAAGLVAAQSFFGALGIPVVDLSPALRARAKELLPEKKYVFYRDDTHWNLYGVEAAARVVAETVRALPAALPHALPPVTSPHSPTAASGITVPPAPNGSVAIRMPQASSPAGSALAPSEAANPGASTANSAP